MDRTTSVAKAYAMMHAHNNNSSNNNNGALGILGTHGTSDGLFYLRGTAESQETNAKNRRANSFGISPYAMDQDDEDVGVDHDDDGDAAPFDDDDNDGPGYAFTETTTDSNPAPSPTTIAPTDIAAPRHSNKQTNPWIMLDPHDAGSAKARPLRIGTTFKLPDGLDQPPSECVTGARTKSHKRTRPPAAANVEIKKPAVYTAIASFHASLSKEARIVDGLLEPDQDIATTMMPPHGLAFGDEFAYVHKATAKRQAAERREKRKLLRANPTAVPVDEAEHLLGYNDDYNGDGDDDDDSYDNAGFQPFDEDGLVTSANLGKSCKNTH